VLCANAYLGITCTICNGLAARGSLRMGTYRHKVTAVQVCNHTHMDQRSSGEDPITTGMLVYLVAGACRLLPRCRQQDHVDVVLAGDRLRHWQLTLLTIPQESSECSDPRRSRGLPCSARGPAPGWTQRNRQGSYLDVALSTQLFGWLNPPSLPHSYPHPPPAHPCYQRTLVPTPFCLVRRE